MRRFARLVVAAALCTVMGSAVRAQAAAAVTPADAGKFMGTWLITLDSPQGPFTLTMTLTDTEGKVACELASDAMGTQKVSDVSKAGEDLVLKYQGDFQGQAFAAKVTLTPVDDKLGVVFDIMDGQFTMSGVGARKQ